MAKIAAKSAVLASNPANWASAARGCFASRIACAAKPDGSQYKYDPVLCRILSSQLLRVPSARIVPRRKFKNWMLTANSAINMLKISRKRRFASQRSIHAPIMRVR
jgi:hypothetical protein